MESVSLVVFCVLVVYSGLQGRGGQRGGGEETERRSSLATYPASCWGAEEPYTEHSGEHQQAGHPAAVFLLGPGGLTQVPAPLFLGSLCCLNELKNLGRSSG